MLWHPHQRLWNRELARRVRRGAFLDHSIVAMDSLLLLAVVIARIRWVQRILKTGRLRSRRVLYIDCGTHREGKEVKTVDGWLRPHVECLDILAFEANPDHFEVAKRRLAGIENLTIHNVAIVGPEHEGSTVELFLSGRRGKADSLFSKRQVGGSVKVPAARLSDYVARSNHDARLLRMNIEGAELFVIEDLIDARQVETIQGYFGMWDDLGKISPTQDVQFRQLLSDHRIRPITFNDRDFANPRWANVDRPRVSARIRLFAIRQAVLAAAGGHLR